MIRVYLDANVFVYAAGGASPHREPCRDVLRATATGRLGGETSAYTIQEVVRQRRRRSDTEATTRAREVAALCGAVHPVDEQVALSALDVMDREQGLDIADAIHVATALTQGIALIVSADRDLDAVTGVERIDPLDGDRLAALTSE